MGLKEAKQENRKKAANVLLAGLVFILCGVIACVNDLTDATSASIAVIGAGLLIIGGSVFVANLEDTGESGEGRR